MLSNDRVLVVDDSAAARAAIVSILRDHLFCKEIIEANDGQDALRKINQISNLDWIFCDWEMPNLSGLDVLKEIRSKPQTSHLPFIMVTAKGDRDSLVAAVQEGVTSYIIKPFTAKKLVEKVFMAKGRMERRNAERTKVGKEEAIKIVLPSKTKTAAKLIDISLSGFLCLIQHEVVGDTKIFDKLIGQFILPKTKEVAGLPCQLIRLEADPHYPARTSHIRLAARFLPMQEAQRQLLVSYIEQVSKTK